MNQLQIMFRSVFSILRVLENEDLFIFSPETEASLKPWKTYVCVCPEEKQDQSEINKEICSTVQECLKGTVIGQKTCKIQNSRQRHDVRRHERFPRALRKVGDHFVVKVCLAVKTSFYFKHVKYLNFFFIIYFLY